MTDNDIAARFERDTAGHELTVLHDDGLYRHLRLAQPGNSEYWYELVTWPGSLAVRGDFGDDWIFSRLPDMFEFFRGDRVNLHYWAQKVERGRDSCRVYDEDAFRRRVTEAFVGAVRDSDAPRGLGKALRSDVLDFDLSSEEPARRLLEDFEFEDFRFEDTWEWDFREYDPAFVWSCHAIVDGIRRYDEYRAGAAVEPTGAVAATPMSAEREAEIRAVLGAVPAGPWWWRTDCGSPDLITQHSGWLHLLGAEATMREDGEPQDDIVVRTEYSDRKQRRVSIMRSSRELGDGFKANPVAAFVAQSPTLVAELLAENARLRALVATESGGAA